VDDGDAIAGLPSRAALVLKHVLDPHAERGSDPPSESASRDVESPFRPGLRHLMVAVVSIGIGCYLDLDSIRKLGRMGSVVTILCDIGLVVTVLTIGLGRRLSAN